MCAQGTQPPLKPEAAALASYPIALSLTESTGRSLVADSNAQQVSHTIGLSPQPHVSAQKSPHLHCPY